MTYDVAIIGAGRVGLPLSLSFAKIGLRVLAIDRDKRIIESIRHKKMPFEETDCDKVIQQVEIIASTQISDAKQAANLIITVGTPLNSHIETDLRQLNSVVEELCPYLQKGQNLILRSTIAPGTTDYVHKYIEMNTKFVIGRDIYLTFCPERIAEGKALKEINALPQVVGAEDDVSFDKASSLFSRLTCDILRTNYRSAELVKLFNNTSRYIYFAMANQFAIIADAFGADIYDILYMTNYKYPRGVIPQPGFTAGTCLRKDFGMINENIPYSDLLLSAWKVNEFLPKFLVQGILKRTSINMKKVAVLGYTFKKDTDDTRDSLVPKLIRYIQREVPQKISVHEPNISGKLDGLYDNEDLHNALENADIIFFGTNHSVFKEKYREILTVLKPDCWIIDIWNIGERNQIFYQA